MEWKGCKLLNRFETDSLRGLTGSTAASMTFAEIRARLDSIDKKLDDQGSRITRLEVETSPLKR
jgi:hypothetical protein